MVARQTQVNETRLRIIEATLDLWVEMPYDLMTLDAIAERAGTTRQTVLRHYGSKDDLAMAAATWQGEQIAAFGHGSADDPAGALDRLVERYERYGDSNARLGDLEGRFEFADMSLQRGRTNHRRWIEDIFAVALGAIEPTDRRRLVDALYAATDVMTWKLLRRDFGRSKAATRATIGTLVEGALAAVPGAAQAIAGAFSTSTQREGT